MEFVELTSKEFDKVCDNFPGNSFYQNSAWAEIKAKNGWVNYYVGVKKNNKIVACSLILGKKLYLNKYMYYAPRGVLLDYHDEELLTFFITNIKIFLKNKNGVLFKIDPLVIYKNHDKDGNYLDDNFSNQSIIDNLRKLGFKHHGFTVGYSEEIQFRWSHCLDITQSEKEILKDMNQRCQRCIKKYQKYPLTITDVDESNIQDFKDIMEHTAKRQNHFDRSLEYYQNLGKYLGERCKLVIVYLDRQKFLKEFPDDKLYNLINEESRKRIPISAGVFIFDKDRANYVYGGTYRDYMPLMAQYKMQMEMINLAISKKIPIYDFGGISGNFKPNTENYGVYEFKRGFGGYVVEYIGEFDLLLRKTEYIIYIFGYKLYRTIKHIIAKIIKK